MEEMAPKWDLRGWTAISGDGRNTPGGRNHFRKAGGQGAGEREGSGGLPQKHCGSPRARLGTGTVRECELRFWTAHRKVGRRGGQDAGRETRL